MAVAALLLVTACGSTNPSSTPSNPSAPSDGTAAKTAAGPSTSAFGLPFPAGTMVSLGGNGLHDENFSSLPGGYTLAGAGSDTTTNPPGVPVASLDLLAPVGTAVTPLTTGTVVAAWPDCQVVLVDHGGGIWVEYVHLNVGIAVGTQVTQSTVLGTVLPVPSQDSTPNPQCGDLESTAPHVHFAFLSGSAMQGQYLPMAGRMLCGHTVDDSGDLAGLGTAGGAQFPVPDCGRGSLTAGQAPTSSAVASAPSAAQTSGPTAPPASGKVIAIAAGNEYACALLSGGGVKCWGRSDSGQLGNGSTTYWDGGTTQFSTPKYVVGLTSGATTIAVGTDYTCALTSAGGVKCWPLDMHGTVGDVPGLTNGITAITARNGLYGSACALTSAGGVKCWGASYDTAPVDVAGLTTGVAAIAPRSGNEEGCALTSAGGVQCWGNNGAAPIATDVLPPSSGATAFAAGSWAGGGCAIVSAGGVKCWGNPLSQVIDVAGVSGITAIAFGGRDMCVLTSGGGVKCLGANQWGQLGNGSDKDSVTLKNVVGLTSGITAIAAGERNMCALTGRGGVKCWGSGFGTTPVDVVGLTRGVTAIAMNDEFNWFACALTGRGGVKCWGSGYGPAPVDVAGF